MNKWWKISYKRVENKGLELISIHIPKTAGTSFRNTLKKTYGEQEVARLDITKKGRISLNQKRFRDKTLPANVRVIHGHFSAAMFRDNFTVDSDIPYITWLRNPVDRVASNFYYLEKRLKEILDERGSNLNILSKMQKNLLEYASSPINQNRITKFLDGIELSQFLFVGIQEHYSEDLKQLSILLEWDKVEEYKHNITGTDYGLSKKDIDFISSCNKNDILLYEKALRLRDERIKHF